MTTCKASVQFHHSPAAIFLDHFIFIWLQWSCFFKFSFINSGRKHFWQNHNPVSWMSSPNSRITLGEAQERPLSISWKPQTTWKSKSEHFGVCWWVSGTGESDSLIREEKKRKTKSPEELSFNTHKKWSYENVCRLLPPVQPVLECLDIMFPAYLKWLVLQFEDAMFEADSNVQMERCKPLCCVNHTFRYHQCPILYLNTPCSTTSRSPTRSHS